MRKVALFSLLLIIGLVGSQFLPGASPLRHVITLATMVALSFIMIHVGYEFELDRSRPRALLWDYTVAFTAAAFPWVFCAIYFVFVMAPPSLWGHTDLWREVLLQARFASPTSAGVLFSMLAAAGLGATWVFRKARILAIFDDVDTILLMVPLTMMMVGPKPQLGVLCVAIGLMLWAAWKWLRRVPLPTTWPWVLGYAAAITALSEGFLLLSTWYDPSAPVHFEVLLPAFVLGCLMRPHVPPDVHIDALADAETLGPESPVEQRVSGIVSAVFMLLVGLSMPPFRAGPTEARSAVLPFEGADPAAIAAMDHWPGWGMIALHVLAVTALANLGKMFPALCYRREATLRERLAVAVGMWPRGEVGAGVLVVSIGYGLGGPVLTVAVLSLALNLLLTGVFILAVKRLIAPVRADAEAPTPAASEA